MKVKDIYKFSHDYLVKVSDGAVGVTDIDKFINTQDAPNCKSLSDVFEMLLVILQDFQMYPNVIKYHLRQNDIKEAIHFPNLEFCSRLNSDELANYFIEKYNSNSQRCWQRYCKGIISGAKFLSSFSNYDDFNKTLNSFDLNIVTREAFALFLQTKIDNMGFAVACNWLKELGYVNYPKPDVHMKDICCAFGLIDSKKKDIDCFEAMIRVANECGVEPYKLDKVWWLICSGNYYRYNIQLPNPQKTKNDFLSLIKVEFK